MHVRYIILDTQTRFPSVDELQNDLLLILKGVHIENICPEGTW